MKKIISIAAAIGAILFGAASCINVDPTLGSNFIPTDHIWEVYPCNDVVLEKITMQRSDCLSGYSTSRFTFGSVREGDVVSNNSTTFTLVPFATEIDFGKNPEVLQFHFTALRDTVSTLYSYQNRMLQNYYVHPLKKAVDSTILYTGTFYDEKVLNEYVNTEKIITEGMPVYDGGDSLSFNFSKEYALEVMEGIKRWQSLDEEQRDSLSYYLKEVPGIYIRTSEQTENGGRINMFNLPVNVESGYLDANFAELKVRSTYDDRQVDTIFTFFFGPAKFMEDDDTDLPSQYALNASVNLTKEGFIEEWESGSKDKLYVEGGSGYKPVVTAREIKDIVDAQIAEYATENIDLSNVVINKATIYLPYNVGTDYETLDRYPHYLSPTVRLVSDNDKYITYAGLTDSSIESENQGNINRSLSTYCPDVSHHVQEIAKLKQGVGEDVDPNETAEEFEKRLAKYDIWFLILHEEIIESSSSSSSSYNDYYNNLMYNSYYNNMMYDPYGYGYGYGGYGYGYGGYGYGGYGGYGYDNYYNYYMMAAYASSSAQTSSSSSEIELDKDRFYNSVLNGPGAGGNDIKQKPRLKITFSAPKKGEF